MRYEVDLVVLGDAAVGKSCLIQKFLNNGGEETGPTVGVDGSGTTVTTEDGDVVDVMLWDYAGQERYTRLRGDFLRGADGCILVFDVLVRDSFAHIDLWHDEFLQNSSGSSEHLPPNFILIGNKADQLKGGPRPESDEIALQAFGEGTPHKEDVRETCAVPEDEVLGWCSNEHVDVTLWGTDSPVVQQPIPYFETSAVTGTLIRDAFMKAVERGVLRQKRLADIKGHEEDFGILPNPFATSDLDTPTPTPEEANAVSAAVDIKLAIMGDACTGKSSFLHQCKTEEFDERYTPTQTPSGFATLETLDDHVVKLDIVDIPGKERMGPLPLLRGCHACAIAVAANNSKSLERARLWKEVFIRESGIRDTSSVCFILLHTKSDLDDVLADVPSRKAMIWAESNNCQFVSCNSTEHAKAVLALKGITQSALTRRLECIYERVKGQMESAEKGRLSQEILNKKNLERERQALFRKHPAAPAQAYVDGKVWTGKKDGKVC